MICFAKRFSASLKQWKNLFEQWTRLKSFFFNFLVTHSYNICSGFRWLYRGPIYSIPHSGRTGQEEGQTECRIDKTKDIQYEKHTYRRTDRTNRVKLVQDKGHRGRTTPIMENRQDERQLRMERRWHKGQIGQTGRRTNRTIELISVEELSTRVPELFDL